MAQPTSPEKPLLLGDGRFFLRFLELENSDSVEAPSAEISEKKSWKWQADTLLV